MPPCPWTIAFGRPVVPDEYSTQSGWSNATRTGAGAAGSAGRRAHRHAPRPRRGAARRRPVLLVAGGRDDHGGPDRREPVADRGELLGPVPALPAVAVAVDGQEHLWLDLGKAVDHAGAAELGGAGGPDGAEARRGQEPDHRLGHVGQVGRDPV